MDVPTREPAATIASSVGHAGRQILPVAEEEEEAVVGARAEHQRRQKKLQQGGDVDAEVGRLGDERSRQRQREAGGCQRDEWCKDRTEREREQENDEQDRAHDRDGLGAHRRCLLIDQDRQRAGEVQREPRVARHAERVADGVHGVAPCTAAACGGGGETHLGGVRLFIDRDCTPANGDDQWRSERRGPPPP